MGTNYYLHKNVCEHCGRSDAAFHIGKSSFGWTFTFRGYRNGCDSPTGEPIISRVQWEQVLASNIGIIKDEYGETHTTENFLELVKLKETAQFNHCIEISKQDYEYSKRSWLDPEGNSFTDWEFC